MHLNFSPSKSHTTTLLHIPVARERCEDFLNFNSCCDSNCTLGQRQIAKLLFVSLSTHYKLDLLCIPDTASLVDVHKPYWPNFSNAVFPTLLGTWVSLPFPTADTSSVPLKIRLVFLVPYQVLNNKLQVLTF